MSLVQLHHSSLEDKGNINMGDQRSSKKMMNLGSIAGSDAGSSITGGKLDDGKRKSRNLSEKKRRDQFNLLISGKLPWVHSSLAF